KVVSEACYAQGMNQSAPGGDCPNGQDSMVGNGAGVPCTYSALDCPHGTHVAGIAAGTAGVNGAPSSTGGVARDASIIAINVFSYAGVDNLDRPRAGSWTSDQIKGLERVHQLRNSFDIAAVNMSLGSNETFGSYCDAGQSGMKAAIDLLRSVGIPTVIASGNGGQGLSISAPACISTAVSVGASTDSDTSVTLFSNESFQLNLLAPGETINSSVCTV